MVADAYGTNAPGISQTEGLVGSPIKWLGAPSHGSVGYLPAIHWAVGLVVMAIETIGRRAWRKMTKP